MYLLGVIGWTGQARGQVSWEVVLLTLNLLSHVTVCI
jgi:hypothetical protein